MPFMHPPESKKEAKTISGKVTYVTCNLVVLDNKTRINKTRIVEKVTESFTGRKVKLHLKW